MPDAADGECCCGTDWRGVSGGDIGDVGIDVCASADAWLIDGPITEATPEGVAVGTFEGEDGRPSRRPASSAAHSSPIVAKRTFGSRAILPSTR